MEEKEGSRKRKRSAAGAVEPAIPDKLYFRIGEVGRLLAVAPYVLRQEGYTIPGARQMLKGESRERTEPLPLAEVTSLEPAQTRLRRMRSELKEISSMLSLPVAGKHAAISASSKSPQKRGMHLAGRRNGDEKHGAVPLFPIDQDGIEE